MGKVKTRLARDIGEAAALRVYLKLMEMTRDVVQLADASKFLFYDKSIVEDDAWHSDDYYKRVQSKGDLGDRMASAFEEVFQDVDKAIIIGSDCPTLNPEIIADAFRALENNDVVLGPTFDGGYYLLGMKKLHAFLFSRMSWSTDTVFEESMHRIKTNLLQCHVLPKLSDVDYLDDLKKTNIQWKD